MALMAKQVTQMHDIQNGMQSKIEKLSKRGMRGLNVATANDENCNL